MTNFQFGPYLFKADQTLWLMDQLVHLSPIQRRLLRCFCENPRQVLSKAQLMQQVWGDADITEVSLARTVHGLRRRFIENGQSKDLIRNVYSEGYIFTANVTPTTEAFAVAAPAA